MSNSLYIVPEEVHARVVRAAFLQRGFSDAEADSMGRICGAASRHGIQSHNAIKALHLDDLFGSKQGGCVPGVSIEVIDSRFRASSVWNANLKCGPAVAFQAMDECIRMADEFGTGMVAVDNAFHYLWGGGYVLEAAQRGYIAYTGCTAMLAEVVPFGGKSPTLGTNPHSWAFPTTEAVGFPILVDWATSVVAMGKVQQVRRGGGKMPMECGVDADGRPTNDPAEIVALLPFGEHKGYGLSLIDELMAGHIGGSLPTLRGRYQGDGRKRSTCFFFQVIHPEAIAGRDFDSGRSVAENTKAIVADILGHGNDNCLLPGQIEARAAAGCERAGGLLFSETEIDSFNEIARECGGEGWNKRELKLCEK